MKPPSLVANIELIATVQPFPKEVANFTSPFALYLIIIESALPT